MHLHEYQAKELLAAAGVPVPAGRVADSVDAALRATGELAPAGTHARWVVKAQVHAGGRGKAGGVRICTTPAQVRDAAAELLGSRLVTAQTGADGLPVDRVLIEPAQDIAAEFYLSLLIDRAQERIALIVSAAGGMDIEQTARETPERVARLALHPAVGPRLFHLRQCARALGLEGAAAAALAGLITKLYALFLARDLGLIELNPLAQLADGSLCALDAKLAVDDNALYRQPELAAWRDPAQEDATERAAAAHGLNYVSLTGDIGCMVNGAGLAMATLDVIQQAGGAPANFLDVGGGTDAGRVAEALKLIVAQPRVRAVLINIFGGIVRCDLIAQGVIEAARAVQIEVPLIVRLEGTHAGLGRRLLEDSGLAIATADDLAAAAQRAVAAARAG